MTDILSNTPLVQSLYEYYQVGERAMGMQGESYELQSLREAGIAGIIAELAEVGRRMDKAYKLYAQMRMHAQQARWLLERVEQTDDRQMQEVFIATFARHHQAASGATAQLESMNG